jgi:hypothetical protein
MPLLHKSSQKRIVLPLPMVGAAKPLKSWSKLSRLFHQKEPIFEQLWSVCPVVVVPDQVNPG